MAEALWIGALVVAIAAVLILKARQTIRRDAGAPRGLAPGSGDHIIDVEYSSGLGGGHATQIRVPRDPQAYARRFVPAHAARSGPAAAETQGSAPAGGAAGQEERAPTAGAGDMKDRDA